MKTGWWNKPVSWDSGTRFETGEAEHLYLVEVGKILTSPVMVDHIGEIEYVVQ